MLAEHLKFCDAYADYSTGMRARSLSERASERRHVTTTADPTQRKRSHAEELERLQSEVDALRCQLRHSQRLATVGTMAAMVAHEFNNILTPIINYARLARKNPKLAAKAVDRAAAGGERATAICRAILGVAHEGPEKPERAGLAELIREALAAMARDPAKDGIEFCLDVPGHLELNIRRAELQQVLMNLLLNARHAVIEGDRPRCITVSGRVRSGTAQIQVSDTGVGIDPEAVDRIFEPFYTTRGGGESPSGHGLGLTLCRDIVESMDGSIEVESTPGEGTTFTIRLPAGTPAECAA